MGYGLYKIKTSTNLKKKKKRQQMLKAHETMSFNSDIIITI